jgi:hypothetical protein
MSRLAAAQADQQSALARDVAAATEQPPSSEAFLEAGGELVSAHSPAEQEGAALQIQAQFRGQPACTPSPTALCEHSQGETHSAVPSITDPSTAEGCRLLRANAFLDPHQRPLLTVDGCALCLRILRQGGRCGSSIRCPPGAASSRARRSCTGARGASLSPPLRPPARLCLLSLSLSLSLCLSVCLSVSLSLSLLHTSISLGSTAVSVSLACTQSSSSPPARVSSNRKSSSCSSVRSERRHRRR